MAVTVDATVGGANSNAYLTAAQATSYFEGRLDTAPWTDASSDEKNRALVMATSRLEQERYVGSPTSDTQRLQWPRDSVPDLWGSYYDNDAIPRYVIEATAELALALLKDNTLLADSGLEAFTEVSVGPLSVTPRHERKPGTLPRQVIRLLTGLRESGTGQVPIIRG